MYPTYCASSQFLWRNSRILYLKTNNNMHYLVFIYRFSLPSTSLWSLIRDLSSNITRKSMSENTMNCMRSMIFFRSVHVERKFSARSHCCGATIYCSPYSHLWYSYRLRECSSWYLYESPTAVGMFGVSQCCMPIARQWRWELSMVSDSWAHPLIGSLMERRRVALAFIYFVSDLMIAYLYIIGPFRFSTHIPDCQCRLVITDQFRRRNLLLLHVGQQLLDKLYVKRCVARGYLLCWACDRRPVFKRHYFHDIWKSLK